MNPVRLQGFFYLYNACGSKLSSVSKLNLYKCFISYRESYLVGEGKLLNTDCVFSLKYLNLSYNYLGGEMMRVLVDRGVISSDIHYLSLVHSCLKDQ